jgi:chitinase
LTGARRPDRPCSAIADRRRLRSIDIDWEYPGQQGEGDNVVSPNDSANFLLFLQTLRSIAGVNARLSMSVNVAGMVGPDGITLTDLSGFAAVLDCT